MIKVSCGPHAHEMVDNLHHLSKAFPTEFKLIGDIQEDLPLSDICLATTCVVCMEKSQGKFRLVRFFM